MTASTTLTHLQPRGDAPAFGAAKVTKPQIKWISPDDPPGAFPPVADALRSPNGLLAAGGDLAAERLLHAYASGIFPWFESGQPILWWAPDPRCVLRPGELHLSRRFRRSLAGSQFSASFNAAFDDVIQACGGKRDGHSGTWITHGMIEAYSRLHSMGWAHSVEIWERDDLVGGIYGIAIGRAFFGESMFSHATNASKVALLALCRQLIAHDFVILDCQVSSPHLLSLGAVNMPRAEFSSLLRSNCSPALRHQEWPHVRLDAAALLHV